MSLVNVSIVGNIIKTPEKTQFPSGKTLTTMVVAVKTPGRVKSADGQWDTEFYKIEAWGRLGIVAHRYLAKGSYVGASGPLVLDKWQDKQGRDRVTPVVKAVQISLPPPMRVVQADEALSGGASPLAGESTFADGGGNGKFGEVYRQEEEEEQLESPESEQFVLPKEASVARIQTALRA